MCGRKCQEITVQSAGKDFPVGDLGFVAFAGFELYLALQVDVAPGEKAGLDVLVHCPDREAELRMVDEDLVGGLAGHDKWRDYPVDLMELSAGKINALSGGAECFPVFTVCKKGVIAVLMRNRTASAAFIAAVADVRSPFDPVTVFFDEMFAVLVAGGTGSALDAAEDDLITDIGPIAAIAFGAEVMGVVKEPFTCVIFRQSVFSDFFRDGGRILTQIACNVFE